MNPERIGILGGSFDPVHTGHLALARAALISQHLDRVLFMPAAIQPLKRNGPRASDAARLDMLRLALAREPRYELSTLELDRGGFSYLFDTLTELRRRHPRAELFFILGTDALPDFHKWYRAADLLQLCTFLVAPRPGFPPPDPARIQRPAPWPARLLPCPPRDIASSGIRSRIAQNLPIRYLVPRDVAAYIRDHSLYIQGTP